MTLNNLQSNRIPSLGALCLRTRMQQTTAPQVKEELKEKTGAYSTLVETHLLQLGEYLISSQTSLSMKEQVEILSLLADLEEWDPYLDSTLKTHLHALLATLKEGMHEHKSLDILNYITQCLKASLSSSRIELFFIIFNLFAVSAQFDEEELNTLLVEACAYTQEDETLDEEQIESKKKVISFLIDCVNSLDGDPQRAAKVDYLVLKTAIQQGHQKIVTWLLERNPQFLNTAPAREHSAFLLAVRSGDYQITEALIKRGAELNQSDHLGNTALHYAVKEGREDLLKLLLAQESTLVDQENSRGQTPLHCLYEHVSEGMLIRIAAALLDRGALINHRDVKGNTPLHEVVDIGAGLAEFLVSRGAQVTLANLEGETPLDVANEIGLEAVANFLKSRGVTSEREFSSWKMNQESVSHLHAFKAPETDQDLLKALIQYLYPKIQTAPLSLEDKEALLRLFPRLAEWGEFPEYLQGRFGNLLKKIEKEHNKLERARHINLFIENALEWSASSSSSSDFFQLLLLFFASSPQGVARIHLQESLNTACFLGKEEKVRKCLSLPGFYIELPNASPLILASRNNHIKIAGLLIDKGFLVYDKDSEGLTALHHAALYGQVEMMGQLISLGADLKDRDKQGRTAFHLASLAGQKEVIVALLNSQKIFHLQANVNDKAILSGMTLLHYAVLGGHIELADLLFEHKADSKHLDVRGYGILEQAILSGNREMIEWVEQTLGLKLTQRIDRAFGSLKGMEIENINRKIDEKTTPLTVAVEHGNLEIVQRLLDLGADPHLGSALEVAAKQETGTLKLLLKATTDLSKLEKPLIAAVDAQNIQNVELLLDRGVNVDIMDDSSEPLFFHAVKRGNLPLLKLLLQGKTKKLIDQTNGYLETALHLAVPKDLQLVRFLIESGVPVNAQDSEGNTALITAVREGSKECAVFLLSSSAAVDTVTHQGKTALHIAAQNGNKELIQILINAKADLNKRDFLGNTALHHAVSSFKKESVDLLLTAGADFTLTDGEQKSAFDIAKENFAELAPIQEPSPKQKAEKKCLQEIISLFNWATLMLKFSRS